MRAWASIKLGCTVGSVANIVAPMCTYRPDGSDASVRITQPREYCTGIFRGGGWIYAVYVLLVFKLDLESGPHVTGLNGMERWGGRGRVCRGNAITRLELKCATLMA